MSNRVNLSLSERMYRALSAYAEVVGRTRTAIIVEAMGDRLPWWERAVRSRAAHDRQAVVEGEFGDVIAVVSAGGPSVAVQMNSKAAWNAERERKAAAKGLRRAKAAKAGKR